MSTSFLNQFAEKPLFRSLPGFFCIKDTQSRLVVCSRETLKLIGFASNDEARGKSDDEVRCKAAEHAELYRDQDRRVMTSNNRLKIINVETYTDGKKHIILGEKSPIVDEDGIMHGIFCNYFDITHQAAFHMSKASLDVFLKKKSKLALELTSNLDQDIFTNTESKIAFLLLHGHNIMQIAKQLHRSKRTIESHVENMRRKVDVNTTNELVDYLHASKYVNCFLEQL